MTAVLKLGGSVITEKEQPETVATDALARVADAVAGADGDLVLVHGGGSFGHHHAAARGVTRTSGTADAADAVAIHDAMRRLNEAVLDALAARNVPALPVHPLSCAHRTADGALELSTGQVATMLGEGFVPVLHGDVVAHAGRGVTVLSGDELAVALARGVGADRVGLCSGVPGVLDEEGEVVGTVETFADVAAAVGTSDATDVTGGMAGKVRALLDLGMPASIFGVEALPEFLAGGTPGTLVDGSGPA